MEEKVTKDIIKASDSIRKKYRLLKRGIVEEEETLRKQFEPLIKPLETLIDLTGEEPASKRIKIKDKGINTDERKRGRQREKTPNKSGVVEHEYVSQGEASKAWDEWTEKLKNYGPLSAKYLTDFLLDSRDAFDTTFGVRAATRGTGWNIGNKAIEFDRDDFVHIGSEMFPGTKGLYELLFKKFPNVSDVKNRDMETFKKILKLSSAHKQGYFPNARIASSGGNKYINFISKLFKKGIPEDEEVEEDGGVGEVEESVGGSTSGGSLLPVTDRGIDYIYWNDPNELITRLELLKGSEKAGNNAVLAEIASIEEELREENIIE